MKITYKRIEEIVVSVPDTEVNETIESFNRYSYPSDYRRTTRNYQEVKIEGDDLLWLD